MSYFELSFGNYDFYLASDECGRGPLAGPVIACSVGVTREKLEEALNHIKRLGVKDSKKLSAKSIAKIINDLGLPSSLPKRFKNFKNFKSGDIYICLSAKSNTYIDEKNILIASLDGMNHSGLKVLSNFNKYKNALWLIDGPHVPRNRLNQNIYRVPIVKGDSKSLLIGLSSIIAKYYRDEQMKKMDHMYPGYNLSKNKGYPTKEHLAALKNLGATPIHRKTFKGVVC